MHIAETLNHSGIEDKRIQNKFAINGSETRYRNSGIPGMVQPKLKIGRPGDKYEQEADRVADNVMRMPNSQLQMQTVEEKEEMLQMQPIEKNNEPKMEPAIQMQETHSDEKNMESINYPKLRRVEIKVQPDPVIVYDFPVSKAPGERDVGPKEFITKRIKAGDEAMIQAANDAGLITLAKKSLEDLLPSFSFTTSDEIQWEITVETIRLYEKYRKYEKEKSPYSNTPTLSSPTAIKKPNPEQVLYFAHDSTEFSERTTAEDWNNTVSQVVAYLRNLKRAKTIKPKYQNVTPIISVHGYASPEGTGKYNQKLSDRRAGVVAKRLANAISEAGFDYDDYVIYGIGKGEEQSELIIY